MKKRQNNSLKSGDFLSLAKSEFAAGRAGQALPLLLQGMSQRPADQRLQNLFVKVVRGRTLPADNPQIVAAMTTCLVNPKLYRQHLLTPWLSLLQADKDFLALMKLSGLRDYGKFADQVESLVLQRVLQNQLIIAGLAVFVVPGALIEWTLTSIRRYLLMQQEVARDNLDFVAALAMNCFYNEYIFAICGEEEDRIASIKPAGVGASSGDLAACQLALLGCYEPLAGLDDCNDWYQKFRKRGGWFTELMERQIGDRLQEAKLVSRIPSITRIKDTVSQSVRSQYEENPYPRWQSWPVRRSSANTHAADRGLSILNAGCGTGQSTVFMATAGINVSITAIDLSLSSLAFAKRQADAMGLENVSVAQADILELGDWSERFDAIASGGVLHHLENPQAGWSNLIRLMKPGAVMRIGLYSELARQPQVAARQWIDSHGLTGSAGNIRRFRQHVFALQPGDPVKELEDKLDFYSLSDCRDLVFHVMEHRYTCLQLQQLLERLELRFLGFCHLDALTRSRFVERYGDPDDGLNLSNWHEFEREFPQTFTQMYHFYCCRREETVSDRLPVWMQDELQQAQSLVA